MKREDLRNILEQQEKDFHYTCCFLPEEDDGVQPYVGDTMPYYENGTYYIYYLKESGDSFNHSIYLAKTKDFAHFEEQESAIVVADKTGQDEWVGTGSVVKAGNEYLLFYTGHTFSKRYEFSEKVLLAKGTCPEKMEKVPGWEITPAPELMQKLDFRDPQAYYDEEEECFYLTISASCQGVARIVKYRISKDLKDIRYEGMLFTDKEGKVYNLECTDLFRMGEKWYLTFSAQDGCLYYATAEERFGPYSEPVALDGKLFYAAKHVDNGEDFYMVGWGRRSCTLTSLTEVSAWGGNLMVQKLKQRADGSLYLAPVEAVAQQYKHQLMAEPSVKLCAQQSYAEQAAFTVHDAVLLSGRFTFEGKGTFGLIFAFDKPKEEKRIEIDPAAQMLRLTFSQGATTMAEAPANLVAGREYGFTYIQEGSLGVFYIDDVAALTVRVYGILGNPIRLFASESDVTFSNLQEHTRD